MRYSEEALQSWIKPLSATEETRVENTIGMIKDAIERSGLSSSMNMKFLPKVLMQIIRM